MPVPKGTRIGGRTKGTLNKRTIQKLNEVAQQAGEIKRQGRKRAVEVLNELMHSTGGMAAVYQQRVIAAGEAAKASDVEMFKWAMEMTGTFAKALAPFQSPTFKAIAVTVQPEGEDESALSPAGEDGKLMIDDPAALMRIYQKTIKQIPMKVIR